MILKLQHTAQLTYRPVVSSFVNMSLVFGYFLETSRANRLLNRQKILELAKTEAAKPGLDPMGSPWAWMEDPVPPGYRDAFFCPRSETFCIRTFVYKRS